MAIMLSQIGDQGWTLYVWGQSTQVIVHDMHASDLGIDRLSWCSTGSVQSVTVGVLWTMEHVAQLKCATPGRPVKTFRLTAHGFPAHWN